MRSGKSSASFSINAMASYRRLRAAIDKRIEQFTAVLEIGTSSSSDSLQVLLVLIVGGHGGAKAIMPDVDGQQMGSYEAFSTDEASG